MHIFYNQVGYCEQHSKHIILSHEAQDYRIMALNEQKIILKGKVINDLEKRNSGSIFRQ